MQPGTAAAANLRTSNSNLNFNFPANAVSATTQVTASEADDSSLPVSKNSGDITITIFTITTNPSSVTFNVPINVSGSVTLATITIPGARDGLVISNDGNVLLARGYSGLTVFSIAPITPVAGSIGGTISHSFTQIADLTTVVTPNASDGHEGMAINPKDSSRAVILGSGAAIQLLTGLSTTPTVSTSVAVTGASSTYSVTITPDGTKAIVGTDSGIAMFSGVDTGTLTQVGTLFAPSYAGASGSVTLGYVYTLGVTLDGKYAVVGDGSNSSLLVIPITTTGFSAPVGILNGITLPYNDQMVVH